MAVFLAPETSQWPVVVFNPDGVLMRRFEVVYSLTEVGGILIFEYEKRGDFQVY